MTDLTNELFQKTLDIAQKAAAFAANKYLDEKLGGVDQGACGFAWVNIVGFEGKRAKGNNRIGKFLKAAGIEQDYNRQYQIWNPSEVGCQNVDVKEAGARAYAEVLKLSGFDVSVGSRLD